MRIDTLWSCVALEVIGFRCKISVALDNIKNISSCIRNAFVKQNICFSSDMQKYRIFHSFTSANGMLSPWQRYRCRNSRRAKIEFLVLNKENKKKNHPLTVHCAVAELNFPIFCWEISILFFSLSCFSAECFTSRN